jgi:hypothetical protein
MPLLTGALSATRFRVYGTIPQTPSQWEDALASFWFRAPASPAVKRVAGFCALTRPLAEPTVQDWSFNHYVLLGWRIDEKKIDARRFKAELAERMGVWCKMNSRPRCPAAVREELKETLEMEMLQAMRPSLRVIGVLVNLDTGVLLLDSSNTTVVEEITKVFHREIGLRIIEDGYAGESIVEAPTPAFPVLFSSFDPRSGSVALGTESTAVEVAPVRFSGTAVSGFFAWLWGMEQAGEEQLTLEDGIPVRFSLVEEVRFAQGEATHDEVVVRIEAPSGSAEAKEAAKADRVPTGIRLFLRREDREYTMGLSGPLLSPTGIKLPQQVKTGETAEVLYDRMFLYEEVVWILEQFIRLYVEAMLTSAGREDLRRRWADWMLGAEAPSEGDEE